MRKKVTTLEQFITEKQSDFTFAKGELSALLNQLCVAAKIVNREVNKAGLVDILGEYGAVNQSGETQQKLDVFANEEFLEALRTSGECAAVASEENDDMIVFEENTDADYIVMIDPLDGSSNIDVNISVGTIFSITRRIDKTQPVCHADFLQKGTEQVAAGYIVYGSSTMFVYTTGKGVNGFTLDPSIGEFCLSHPEISIPQDGNTYSVNEGYKLKFPEGVKKYLDWVQEIDIPTNRPYTARYIGSLVADFHRNMIKGGMYMYPSTAAAPTGKLRLLFECNPMAFLAEQAGGKATDGSQRILNIVPTELHQRVPIYIGSTNMIDCVESFIPQH